MAWPPILVRYGEIGIKSRNIRAQFERRLEQNLEQALIRRGVEAEIQREQGRLVVRASDVEGALDALRHTFGVVSASPAVETEPSPDAVAKVALEMAREHLPQGGSFAMRCKRTGEHSFSSLDVAKATAARILDDLPERGPRVDLTSPDLAISSEVRANVAYVYTRTVHGPGGLPYASQGRTALLVDGPRSAHVAWLMAKRGASLLLLNAAHDEATAREWLRPMEPWIGQPRLHDVGGGTRAQIYERARPLLEQHKCHAVAVADDAQGAIAHFDADQALGFPVFRPLVGYVGERFRELSREAELPEDA